MSAPSTVTVRRAEPGDRRFVVSLAHRFAQTRAEFRSFEEVESGSVRALSRAFDAPREDEAVFVACDPAGEPLAFAYVISENDFFTQDPHAHLSEIASVRDGAGASGALIAACEAWSRDRGYRYISLNVNAANPRGREIYVAKGYATEYEHMVKLL